MTDGTGLYTGRLLRSFALDSASPHGRTDRRRCSASFPSPNAIPKKNSWLRLRLDVPRRLLQAVVALLVRPPGAESDTDKCGPRPPLEEQDREDDAEAEAEGGLDDQVGQAAVPLLRRMWSAPCAEGRVGGVCVCVCQAPGMLTFSFRSASLTGRDTAREGAAGVVVVSAMAAQTRKRGIVRNVQAALKAVALARS